MRGDAWATLTEEVAALLASFRCSSYGIRNDMTNEPIRGADARSSTRRIEELATEKGGDAPEGSGPSVDQELDEKLRDEGNSKEKSAVSSLPRLPVRGTKSGHCPGGLADDHMSAGDQLAMSSATLGGHRERLLAYLGRRPSRHALQCRSRCMRVDATAARPAGDHPDPPEITQTRRRTFDAWQVNLFAR